MTPRAAARVEGQHGAGQDRAAIFEQGAAVVCVVADGAGGTSGGSEAADRVIAHVQRAVAEGRPLLRATTWRQLLLEVAVALEERCAGQTTAVVAATDGRTVVGAGVGDSGVWQVTPAGWEDLTAGQPRKPLLGGGLAEPFAFTRPLRATDAVLLATDGLLKYADGHRLCSIVRSAGTPAPRCCDQLVEAVRLPSGALQDDVGVIVVRPLMDLLEEHVAAAARVCQSAPTEASDRAFSSTLDAWVRALLPASASFQSDGLVLAEHTVTATGSLVLAGRVWELATQQRAPFRATITLGPNGLRAFDVQFLSFRFARDGAVEP